MNKHTSSPAPTWPMSSEAVNFKNGMIVTAEDLKAAMLYSVQLMQATNRAVYGCGVICGFEIRPDPGLCGKTEEIEICVDGTDQKLPLHRSFRVEVGKGTAMDCSGLPIELCKPMLVDLSPDTCGCDPKVGGCVCIMIRRFQAPEAPRGDCCGTADGPLDCSRLQDHVEIKGFPSDQLPDHYCGRDLEIDDKTCACVPKRRDPDCENPPDSTLPPPRETRDKPDKCTCLKECGECCCCGDGWVLLACVHVTSHGIVRWQDEDDKNWYDNDHVRKRKYIKPIECICPPGPCEEKVTTVESDPDRVYDYKEADDDTQKMIQVMALQDADINARLGEIVDVAGHQKFFRAMGIRSLPHLEYVLETQSTELRELKPVFTSANAGKLEYYLARTREKIKEDRLTER